MQAKGSKSKLLLDFEQSYKTAPAVKAGKAMPFNTCSVKGTRTLQAAQTITGRRDPVMPFAGNMDVAGDLSVPVDVRAMGNWLKAMFGAPATTGAGPYTHTFKLGETMPSFGLEKRFEDIGQYIFCAGCKASKLSMSVGGDAELVASIGIVGATESAPSATPYQLDPACIAFDRFQNFQASIEENGVALANCTEFSLEMDFGLDTGNYVIGGQGTRNSLPEGVASISGTLSALFEDATLLNKAVNMAETSLRLSFTSGSHSLSFLFPEVVLEQQAPAIEGPQGVKIQLPWKAYFGDDAVNNSAVVVTLTNDVAGY
ncbi:phage tail tube protein [Desulfocurvibacter africanus]|uniref:Uncharacterized protein n=1 Tax=Desulfocurvibacter africanus subsp. africanus str. Walvis Bay TaxID=690850 RepID=F3YY27_DESAF|nr:phage tail tube protein [Desulfocurvibacter africanus]EGJ51803.1 hypothetical protein Desaf_3521 [Desulfocurvibacter africanus subsp. africanus str. Walvis Bay]